MVLAHVDHFSLMSYPWLFVEKFDILIPSFSLAHQKKFMLHNREIVHLDLKLFNKQPWVWHQRKCSACAKTMNSIVKICIIVSREKYIFSILILCDTNFTWIQVYGNSNFANIIFTTCRAFHSIIAKWNDTVFVLFHLPGFFKIACLLLPYCTTLSHLKCPRPSISSVVMILLEIFCTETIWPPGIIMK